MNLVSISIFKRGLLQMLRNRFSLLLTILTTPFFLFLYWIVFVGSHTVRIGVFLETDKSVKTFHTKEGNFRDTVSKLKNEMNEATLQNPIAWIELEKIPNTKNYIDQEKHSLDSFDVLLIVKQSEYQKNPLLDSLHVEIYNDGKISSIFICYKIKEFLLDQTIQNYQLPIEVKIEEDKQNQLRFSNFAIGFLVFAMIMMIFSSSQAISVEMETNTWIRYRLSNLPITSYIIGMSSVQLLFGIISILLSYLCIMVLKVDLSFDFLMFIFFCILGLAVHIQIGFLLAAIFKNTMLVFLGSSFIMFLLLLFSGIVFPSPPAIFISDTYSFDVFGLLPSAILKKLLDLSLENKFDQIRFFPLLSQILFYYGLLLIINSYLLKRQYTVLGTD